MRSSLSSVTPLALAIRRHFAASTAFCCNARSLGEHVPQAILRTRNSRFRRSRQILNGLAFICDEPSPLQQQHGVVELSVRQPLRSRLRTPSRGLERVVRHARTVEIERCEIVLSRSYPFLCRIANMLRRPVWGFPVCRRRAKTQETEVVIRDRVARHGGLLEQLRRPLSILADAAPFSEHIAEGHHGADIAEFSRAANQRAAVTSSLATPRPSA